MSEDAIKDLQPITLWKRFYEISQVPRPSKKEERIRNYLKKLFKELNIEFKEDKTGNIIAKVPSSPGYEHSPIVVLQGHVDMVCEKNSNINHDFENDPIKLKKVNGWIAADGTTLGSDNGIGIAAALALITDKDAVHGPLEILLTVDEETGMTGANNLEPGFINGRILLNLDSEEEGVFYIGCSGGIDTLAEFKIEKEKINSEMPSLKISVSGLKGGHSGMDISKERGNSIKILARVLKVLEPIDYRIININGGRLRNAIPREAEASIIFNKEDEEKIIKIVDDFYQKIKNEYRTSDSGLLISCKKLNHQSEIAFSKSFSKLIVNTIMALPHGVIAMSQDIPDLVETSTNLATINTSEKDLVLIGTSQRSSIESLKHYISSSVEAVFNLAGAKVIKTDGYPGWQPDLNSNILKISKKVYENFYNQEPEIKAVHAGLECGILGNKFPGIDMISFGPTIMGAHSPDEKIEIKSVGNFYNLLKGILKEVA